MRGLGGRWVTLIQGERLLQEVAKLCFYHCYSTFHICLYSQFVFLLLPKQEIERKREKERKKEGRKEGWKEGRKEGRKEREKERKRERKKEKKEGRKGEREGERKEGRESIILTPSETTVTFW